MDDVRVVEYGVEYYGPPIFHNSSMIPVAAIDIQAREVLKLHERSERHNVAVEIEPSLQLTMFTPLSQRILDRLAETDIDTLTPLQALNLLEELKAEIGVKN